MIPSPPRLQRLRALARVVLLLERGWPALWPAVAVVGGLVCLALLGVVERLSASLHLLLLVAAIGGALVLARLGLRRVLLPDDAEADRRLEQASALRHRPLAVLADELAPGSGDATLWRDHVARVERSVGSLRVGLPHPNLAGRDRFALRHLLLMGLILGFGVAGTDAPRRLLELADLGGTAHVPRSPSKLDVWVTPPAYTGVAPLLLTASQTEVTIPAGSRLTASLSGGSGAPELRLAGASIGAETVDGESWQAATELTRGGILSVTMGRTPIGHWDLTVVDDVPPVARWTAPPDAARGRVPQTRLPWQVEHPYGVAEMHAELRLRDRPEASPAAVDVPLPSASPRTARGLRQVDLTANAWAGLPVEGVLVARDTGGLRGSSETRAFVLPERAFQHPAARVIVAVRKQLALRPDDRAGPLAALERLAGEEALWQSDPGGYLNLRVVAIELDHARRGVAGAAVIDELQDRLWQLALHLEEESPARTAEALRQARKALKSALEQSRATQDRAKSRPEVERREQELKQALQNHVQALRREARRDPQGAPSPESLARQAQRALQDLQDATEADRQDEAREHEAELEQSLDALEQARRDAGATPRQKKRAEGRERGRKQMGVLQDLIRREGGLIDHAQARAQKDGPEPRASEAPPATDPTDRSPQEVPDQADLTERARDSRTQRALRRALGELMQQHGDLTGQVPPFLGDADQAMRQAQEALGARHDDAAAAAAQQAIAALQEGGQAMSQQLARQFGRERGHQPGGGEPDPDANQGDEGDQTSEGEAAGPEDGQVGDQPGVQNGRNVDPFGRALHEGENGATDGGDTAVPETMEQARSRAVQDELRRRGADRLRPQDELDYIRRLLDSQ